MLWKLTRPEDHPGPAFLNVVLPEQTARLGRGGTARRVELEEERDAKLIRDLQRQGYKLEPDTSVEEEEEQAARTQLQAERGEQRPATGEVSTTAALPPRPGDLVQWTSQGAEQFTEPKRLTHLSEDGAFAFVEGSATGIPLEQLAVVERAATPVEASTPLPPPATTTQEEER